MASAALAHRRLTQREADEICARHDRLWRAKPGGARAVFSYADASGLSFRGRHLNDADFTGAILSGCDFTGASLDHANLYASDLQGACLVDASLRRADLRGVCLRGADLSGADMFEADLREGSVAHLSGEGGLRLLEHQRRSSEANGAVLAGANLTRSKLSGVLALRADFSDAILKEAKLIRANLKQANFNGADLAGADLSGADLHGADLRDAILVGAKTLQWNVSQADLRGALTDRPTGLDVAALPYADMLAAHARWCESGGKDGQPSTFDNADLRSLKSIRGFNLTALSAKGGVFYGLDMEGVQLQGAHLEGADLRSVNLRYADLRGARLVGAKFNGADMQGVNLGPLLIQTNRLLPADLTGASLKNADLTGADLRQAVMTGSILDRALLSGAMTRPADMIGASLVDVRGLAETVRD